MDAIRIKKYQERLLRRKREILSTVNRLEHRQRETGGQGHFDWADQAEEGSESRLVDHLSDVYLRELARTDRALGRMLAGTYGLCLACRRPLEKARIELFPETEFCLRCERPRESLQKAAEGACPC
jgi:RNA polymerase-binding transcription factor DksA